MKKILLFLVLCFASIAPAFAGTCDISPDGLTASQAATLKQNCLDAIKENDAGSIKDVVANVHEVASHANEWGSVAKDFAVAIGIAAHELGVQANTFLDSPAGRLTAAIIIWKMMGHQILALLLCVPLIVFTWYTVFRLSRQILTDTIEYVHTPILWGLFTRRRIASIKFDTNPGEGQGFMGYFIIPALGIVATAILLSIIF